MDKLERQSILDRLAAGELSAAEAMRLLEGDLAVSPAEPAAARSAQAIADEIKIESLDAPALPAKTNDSDAVAGDVIEPSRSGQKGRWLKIRVRDMRADRNKVTITLPLGFVSLALGIARRFNPDMKNVDTDELMAYFKAGEPGILVDAMDDEDGEHVQISIE